MTFQVSTGVTPPTSQSARIIHGALCSALVGLLIVFLALTYGAHAAPLLPPGGARATIGYTLSGVAVVSLPLTLLLVKPRVPARASGQDDAAFWRGALPAAVAVWAGIEGAGVIAAVAGLLTGLPATAIVVAIALACLVVFRPGYFENA